MAYGKQTTVKGDSNVTIFFAHPKTFFPKSGVWEGEPKNESYIGFPTVQFQSLVNKKVSP
jgi:hypothetical protein